MLNSLRPGGKLLIALALPYNPFIDEGEIIVFESFSRSNVFQQHLSEILPLFLSCNFLGAGKRGRRPSRPLPITGRNFADAAASFVTKVADALDLEVVVSVRRLQIKKGDHISRLTPTYSPSSPAVSVKSTISVRGGQHAALLCY